MLRGFLDRRLESARKIGWFGVLFPKITVRRDFYHRAFHAEYACRRRIIRPEFM